MRFSIVLTVLTASLVSGASTTLGPAVGSTIPKFSLADQSGQVRTFDSVKGPNGAVLVFYRSADW